MYASPSCFRLFLHCVLRALSRACCTAGNSNAIRIAMMAMTTSNSIKVNPCRKNCCLTGYFTIGVWEIERFIGSTRKGLNRYQKHKCDPDKRPAMWCLPISLPVLCTSRGQRVKRGSALSSANTGAFREDSSVLKIQQQLLSLRDSAGNFDSCFARR